MKIIKLTLTAIIVLVCSSSTQAQQRSYGQWSAHAYAGLSTPKSWAIGIGVEKNLKLTKGYLSGDFMFFREKYNIRNHHSKINSNNAEFIVQYNYTPYSNRIINLSVGSGIALGGIFYKTSSIGINLPLKNDFSAGITLNAGIEFKIIQEVSLYIQPLYIYDFAMNTRKLELANNSRSKFFTLAGIKYFF